MLDRIAAIASNGEMVGGVGEAPRPGVAGAAEGFAPVSSGDPLKMVQRTRGGGSAARSSSLPVGGGMGRKGSSNERSCSLACSTRRRPLDD